MRMITILFAVSVALGNGLIWTANASGAETYAGGAHSQAQPPAKDGLTPEERMNRRFPQNVRTGDLIGLPLLDYDDRTLGHIVQVVRTSEGKVVLVVRAGGWFGWGARPIGVPIETVAILGRQVALLDIPRDVFLASNTWTVTDVTPIDANQTIRIALTRR